MSAETERPLVFNIDRHLDVRADTPRNSGTPDRQLLEEGVIQPGLFHEFGTNSFANSPRYLECVKGIGAREVCEIADVAASDPRTRIIEITEVCPEFDRDRLTSKLAANIIVRALAKETG